MVLERAKKLAARTIGAALAVALLSAPAAAETHASARLTQLRFDDGDLPVGAGRRGDRMTASWRRPSVSLDGPGEAYIDIRWQDAFRGTGYGDARLAVRLPEPRKVTGTLFVENTDGTGMLALRFEMPAGAAHEDARRHFHEAEASTYADLLERDLAGAAWFRHRLGEARQSLGKAVEQPEPEAPGRPAPRRRTVEETYALFTGGRAVSENLQLDRLLPPPAGDLEQIDIDTLEGINVAEIDWGPLVEGLEPRKDALATSIPADQHALFFPSFQAMVTMLDEAERQGAPLLYLLERDAQEDRTRERYERQLCISASAIARLLGPGMVASVAVTGSDPYLRTGSDFAMLFEARQPALLEAWVRKRHEAALAGEPRATATKGEVAGVSYSAVTTPDRSISSYLATIGNLVMVSNSTVQLERIARTSRGEAPSLASLPEYTFFRGRYSLDDADESAFLFLSDATIRRWCGPRWRIAASRRSRAAAVLAELQATHLEPLARGELEPGAIHTHLHMPEPGAGQLRVTPGGVVSSTYGTLDFLTPIAELPLETVTRAEAESYRRWRDNYQRNWRRFFDPIGVRFTVSGNKIAADVTVMPLIVGSEYRQLVEFTRGVKIQPGAGDPHPETVLHFVLAMNADSPPVRMVSGFAAAMAPGLQAAPPSWLGSSMAVYADESPFWEELINAPNPERFLGEHFHRVPVALRVEIKNSLLAAAFLASARAFVDQTAPGMTVWETLKHRDRPYVRITAAENTEVPADLSNLAIYYAVTPDALTLTLSEDVIRRALDRQIAAKKTKESPEDAAKEASAAAPKKIEPWLGESLAFQGERKAFEILEAASGDHYARRLQALSWSNIPVLNEWRRLFPDTDPVALHQRVWGTRLVCPGGGTYRWNREWQTMESTVFGHPGQPRLDRDAWPLRDITRGRFGLTFENQGLRARAVLHRPARF